jgi:hypothetical protein
LRKFEGEFEELRLHLPGLFTQGEVLRVSSVSFAGGGTAGMLFFAGS